MKREYIVYVVGFGIGFAPSLIFSILAIYFGGNYMGFGILTPPNIPTHPLVTSFPDFINRFQPMFAWAVGLVGLTVIIVYGPGKLIAYLGAYLVVRFWPEFKALAISYSDNKILKAKTEGPQSVRDARKKLARYSIRPNKLTDDWFFSFLWIAGISKAEYFKDLEATLRVWENGK